MCTKRQHLVKLRGPRRLAKSVALQQPEGLNMQQFIGQNDWNPQALPVDVPVFVDLHIMIYPRWKQKLVQLVVSEPPFASAEVENIKGSISNTTWELPSASRIILPVGSLI